MRGAGLEEAIAGLQLRGADLPAYEPKPFDGKWHSRKFHEVGISIDLGHIAWAHGSLLSGDFPNIKIFRLRMKRCLDAGEKAITDSGCQDERRQTLTRRLSAAEKLYSALRARKEAINKRLRQFFALSRRFRHNIALGSSCFHAERKSIQLMIKRNEPLLDF